MCSQRVSENPTGSTIFPDEEDSLFEEFNLFVLFNLGLTVIQKKPPRKEFRFKNCTVSLMWRVKPLEGQHARQDSSAIASHDPKFLTTKLQFQFQLSKRNIYI